jgi:DNA-directed RNA polymerase subunit RPC12/RpoP
MPKGYRTVACEKCGEDFHTGTRKPASRCPACRTDVGEKPNATKVFPITEAQESVPDVVAIIGQLGLDFACGNVLYWLADVPTADDPVAALTQARDWIDRALAQRGAAA